MAVLADVGDAVQLEVPLKGTNIDVALSGTYNMVVALQREKGSKGSGAWETIKTYSTEDATVSDVYSTKSDGEHLQLAVTEDTSGTITATLTDNHNRDVRKIETRDGTVVAEFREEDVRLYQSGTLALTIDSNGISVVGGVRQTGGAVLVTANTTLTVAEHAGRPIVFNDADGATLTLPAAAGTGAVFHFIVAVTVTSNNDIIQVANATDEFRGNLLQVDTDTSDALAAYPALDGDGFDTITLNGSTKGGLIGDWIEVVDVAAGHWALRGCVLGTGSVASPLSAAVS